MKSIYLSVPALVLAVLLLSGCGVYMAAKQPSAMMKWSG